MIRYWISWEEPGDDPRPLSVPSPEYWVTGWGDDYATVCALVDASDQGDAKAIIRAQWKPRRWRFFKAVAPDWRPPADRFPPRKVEAQP